MRRIFLFNMPTLLLSLVGQILGSLLLWFSYLQMASQAIAAAPITPSGLNTQVTISTTPPPGKVQYDITGGTRPGGGVNLFHSFGDFNVPNNNIANFLNDSGLATSNILGRVTGGNISNIFGTIQTTGFGNANLFMMNPAGFLFGPNATVNVGGMVAFTSADYLRLADGVLFNAIPNATADALLSAAPVAAFGFLGSNPGAITVQGSQLSVTPGQSISLVGGNITIQSGTPDSGIAQPARLIAPNGTIQLATAASPGEFDSATLQPMPNINGAVFGSFGSVTIAPGSTVDVSQTGNGRISIRGGQLVLDIQNAFLSTSDPAAPAVVTPGQDTIILSGGSSIASVTASADPGPDVQIAADHVQFLGTPPSFDTGFTPSNPVNIATTTLGSGKAGDITVTANQNMDLSTATITSSSPAATGNAGNINLTSMNGNISMTNGVFVTSQAIGAAGEAGTITLSAPHGDIDMQMSLLLNEIGPFASGGGGIQVTANNLTMGNLSGIQIDNFVRPVSGAITVNLSGSLSLDGNARIATIARGPALAAANLNITAHDVRISEGSILNTETQSSGPGGQLNIVANNLQLTTGGQILSGSNLGVDFMTGQPLLPSGPGGTINIQGSAGAAASVLIDGTGSGIFTNAVGTGAAGNTNITAQSVTVQNGGTISASTSGIAPSATGGAITLNANQVQLITGGQIQSGSTLGVDPVTGNPVIPSGPGGTVTIQGLASPAASLLIDGPGSGIFTNTVGTGAGGNIHLSANSVTLQNGAHVSSSSTGTGNAGNIHINSGNQFAMTNASVTTEANQSSGGAIKITTNPSGTVQLTNSTISASVLNGESGGGSVNIDPQYVLLQNSQILAQAVQGPGGNISITTNLLLSDANSLISASSQFGQNGTITIQSPIAPASRIIPLSQKPLIATALLTQRCAALAGGNFSSFTVAGRDALPAEPSGWLSSPLAALSEGSQLEPRAEGVALETGERREAEGERREATLRAGEGREAGGGHGSEQSAVRSEESGMKRAAEGESTEEPPILSLRRIAPPGFLTQAFAADWSGCTS